MEWLVGREETGPFQELVTRHLVHKVVNVRKLRPQKRKSGAVTERERARERERERDRGRVREEDLCLTIPREKSKQK
jgi:hypothetical protein